MKLQGINKPQTSPRHALLAAGTGTHYLDLIPVPCGHEYCRERTRDLFESSYTDESLFPPRCCHEPMPPETVGIFLSATLKSRYEEKKT